MEMSELLVPMLRLITTVFNFHSRFVLDEKLTQRNQMFTT